MLSAKHDPHYQTIVGSVHNFPACIPECKHLLTPITRNETIHKSDCIRIIFAFGLSILSAIKAKTLLTIIFSNIFLPSQGKNSKKLSWPVSYWYNIHKTNFFLSKLHHQRFFISFIFSEIVTVISFLTCTYFITVGGMLFFIGKLGWRFYGDRQRLVGVNCLWVWAFSVPVRLQSVSCFSCQILQTHRNLIYSISFIACIVLYNVSVVYIVYYNKR